MLDLIFGIQGALQRNDLSCVTGSVLAPITIVILVLVAYRCIRERRGWLRTCILLCLVLSISAIIELSFFPFPSSLREIISARRLDAFQLNSINIIPFRDLWRPAIAVGGVNGRAILWRSWGGHLLMFVPLGFLMPALYSNFRSFRRTFILILGLAFSIELISFVVGFFILRIPYKAISIDYITFSLLGGMIGYLAFRLANRLKRKSDLYCKKRE